MELLRSPRGRLAAAIVAFITAVGLSSLNGFTLSNAARALLLGLCVLGVAVWLSRKNRGALRMGRNDRLQVISRAGLSPKCGLALVEVDGRSLLIVHGDGFARLCETPGPRASEAPTTTPRFRLLETRTEGA